MAVDDGSIPDDAGLLRRVHPDQVVEDKNSGGWRPSSGAFTDEHLSVDAESILEARGSDWQFTVRNHPDHSLVRFAASAARAKALAVVASPLPDNPAHVEVVGRKTGAIKAHLVASSVWVRCIPKA
jgi:hypothetical protein